MKRVFPFALLLCALFAFSGNSNPLHASTTKTSVKGLWWYPSSGVLVGATGGDANWSIMGSGTGGPGTITFSRNGETWGPYSFTSQGSSTYVAGGPRALGVIQSWVINDQVSFTTLW